MTKKPAWYFKNSSLFVAFLVVGPFMLPLLWTNPRFKRTHKIMITVIVLLATWGLLVITANSFKSLKDYYGMMSDM